MIFPVIIAEKLLQVNDPTRIDYTKSFKTPNEAAFSIVRIEPYSGAGYINATATNSSTWFLDYAYSTAGIKTVTVEMTTNGAATSKTYAIEVVTAANDGLITSDNDILTHEPGILAYLKPGRTTFIDIHRQSKNNLLDYLDQQAIWDEDGNRLSIEDITDHDTFRQWAKYETLRLIFDGNSNAIDDVHAKKASQYRDLRDNAAKQAAFRLDRNNDGETDADKYNRINSDLVRR
jgi:hypothetical protein